GRRDRRGRSRRALLIAGVCSVLLHVLLAALVLLGGIWSEPRQAKKGEPLFVDIAPHKPQERAPAGNPSRPPRAPARPTLPPPPTNPQTHPPAPTPPRPPGPPARPPSPPPAPKAAEAKVRVAEAFDP